MAQRLTRGERKSRTRAELVEAARAVFKRRGFHAASLEEIADEAGYTKGAVYSNFTGKDELFLAALDAHLADRLRTYADLLVDEERIEDAYRAVARVGIEADRREPEWAGLQLEFWAHASRRASLRVAVSERRERFLDVIADLVEELASRHGVSYRLPVKEVVRGSGALLRGMSIERLLDPGSTSASAALFEEMHVAYMTGLTEERTPTNADGRGTP